VAALRGASCLPSGCSAHVSIARMISASTGYCFVSNFEWIFFPSTKISNAPPELGTSSKEAISVRKWLNSSAAKLAALGA
jgi:hypothetical protein